MKRGYFRNVNVDKTKELFEEYKSVHGEYPTTNAIRSLYPQNNFLPSVRWIQVKGGGLLNFYRTLGLKYSDARTGARRSSVAIGANKKSQSLDVEFANLLEVKFGAESVHWQSPYNKEGMTLHRADFKVFDGKDSFFFVDLFFPQDIFSFQGCINLKVKKLQKVKIEKDALVYLVCCNSSTVSSFQITEYLRAKKNKHKANIHILHIDEAKKLLLA